ncbi:MAG: asparagine synthetase B, partial [Bacteroidia bacterium]|nr:asparagine synthetase B [Bacteroidia bacterium]
MKQRILLLLTGILLVLQAHSIQLLIPMDEMQKNHLKSYGIAYWVLEQDVEVKWLLNYRGGSFLMQHYPQFENECKIRGVSYETITDAQAAAILNEIARPEVNQDAVSMNKAPKIAVYSPPNKQPWDDAVMMALEYAEIPYEQIYDGEILDGKLKEYDWLHLHHEDFTGQYGRFYRAFNHMVWYQKQVAENEATATRYGFQKVSQMKLQVALTIKAYVANGGFLFSMCSGADSFDIALASEGIDICAQMYDGDPVDP